MGHIHCLSEDGRVNLEIRSKHSIPANADCAIGLWAKDQNAETDDHNSRLDGRIPANPQIRRQ